jgi:hypothetical protein
VTHPFTVLLDTYMSMRLFGGSVPGSAPNDPQKDRREGLLANPVFVLDMRYGEFGALSRKLPPNSCVIVPGKSWTPEALSGETSS